MSFCPPPHQLRELDMAMLIIIIILQGLIFVYNFIILYIVHVCYVPNVIDMLF